MSAEQIVAAAPAKLNLYLNVVGRRADGYHLLDSLFAFCDVVDELTFALADEVTLEPPQGEFAPDVAAGADNLILKATTLLKGEAGLAAGVRIGLTKRIPVAAGLGGGSADAAATLKALNRLWRLDWDLPRLSALAAGLGADVPACLSDRPVIARGVGDELSDAPALPSCGLVLVNPRLATPTPAVFDTFRALTPDVAPREPPDLPTQPSLDDLLETMRARGNDLLPAAVSVTPAIADVLAALGELPDVLFAGLSGSGATCFAIFADRVRAEGAASALARRTPGWWVRAAGWA